jgi:hypothetical protein
LPGRVKLKEASFLWGRLTKGSLGTTGPQRQKF